MVHVGHRLLLERGLVAGRGPVQVEDRVDPVRVEVRDEALNLLLVAGTPVRIARWEVRVQPAVLVERYPDRVGAPRGDRGRGGGGVVPVVVAVVLGTGVLGTRDVDPAQPDRLAGAIEPVDEVIAGDRDLQGRLRGLPEAPPSRELSTAKRSLERPASASEILVEAPTQHALGRG